MELCRLVRLVGAGTVQSRWEFIDDSCNARANDFKKSLPLHITDDAKLCKDDGQSANCEIDRNDSEENVEYIKKKSNKRSKKKKGRPRADSTCSVAPVKQVHWGKVDEVHFHRILGEHTVPNSGLYPIALGEEYDRNETTVDNHIQSRQLHLLQRVVDRGLDIDMLSKCKQEVSNGDISKPGPLETRQWDYRRGIGNPLFTPLPEEDRVAIISNLKDHSVVTGPDISTVNKEISDLRKGRESVGCSCKAIKPDKLSIAKLKQELIRHKDILLQQKQRGAGRKIGISRVVDGDVLPHPHHRDPADPTAVTPQERSASTDHIREVKGKGDREEGFTIHKLMTLSASDIQALPKNQLQAYMRVVTMSCLLCVANNCTCVAAGIGCHANVCGCSRYNTKQSCSNPRGVTSYDPYLVQQHRQQFVTNAPVPANTKTRPSRANTN